MKTHVVFYLYCCANFFLFHSFFSNLDASSELQLKHDSVYSINMLHLFWSSPLLDFKRVSLYIVLILVIVLFCFVF